MIGKKLVLIVSILAVCGAAAFSQGASSGRISVPPAPNAAMLTGLSPEAVMDLANVWGMNSGDNRIGVSTTSSEIRFIFADGTRKNVALPKDRMVVSIAPYVMKTHPCKDHTPSSCRGEQANTPVKVKAVTADGRTLLDIATQTLPNGFVDLWLPRNEKIDVTIEALGLTATERIGTSDTDQTCITTMKLHY
jgi:hypothetical protein